MSATMLVIAALAIIAIGAVKASAATGGSMSGNLTASQIAFYAQNAGFTGQDLNTAIAIALAESSGNPNALGDNGHSHGLWQIDLQYHPEYAGVNLFDPQTNANAAFAIYEAAGYQFTPWSTYNNNAYVAFLNDAGAATGITV